MNVHYRMDLEAFGLDNSTCNHNLLLGIMHFSLMSNLPLVEYFL